MTAPPSVSLNDLERAFYLAAVPAADNNLGVTMGQGMVTTSRQNALQEQTKINAAHVTAPGAGAGIVSLTAAETGYYQVDVTVGFGATAESTALDNFEFLNNGATNGNGMLAVANVANTMSPPYRIYAQITAGQNFSINAIVAGSAGSIYKAAIMATRIA
jgi:hypothetical protein